MTAEEELPGDRRQLINLAYRLLGGLSDAEDAVQAGYLRWFGLSATEQSKINNADAWLTTTISRICLDQLTSARARRESYVGAWLPEPLPTDPLATSGSAEPADQIVLDESVTTSFLMILDAMTPAERVAFVLHDVYRFPYAEIGDVLGRSAGACRELASSARRRLDTAEGTAAPTEGQAVLIRKFLRAWNAHDIDALIGLLDPDVVAVTDSGGKARALREPLHGGRAVADFLLAVADRAGDVTVTEHLVNGRPGLVARQGSAVVTVWSFEIADGVITRLLSVRNPDKLTRWSGVILS